MPARTQGFESEAEPHAAEPHAAEPYAVEPRGRFEGDRFASKGVNSQPVQPESFEPARFERDREVQRFEEHHVEVAPTHIAVHEPPLPREARGTQPYIARPPPATEPRVARTPTGAVRSEEEPVMSFDVQHRDRLYHDFVETRRVRRWTIAGATMAALAVVVGIELLVAGPSSLGGFLAGLSQAMLSVVAVGALLVGIAIAWGCARSNLAALGLAWIAGFGALLFGTGILVARDAGTAIAGSSLAVGLTGLLGLVGLVTLVATTLALASWRGERVQQRILVPAR